MHLFPSIYLLFLLWYITGKDSEFLCVSIETKLLNCDMVKSKISQREQIITTPIMRSITSARENYLIFYGALDHLYVLSIYFPLISYSLTWLHYDIFRTSSKRHKPSTGFLNSVYSKILILIKTLFYFSLQQFPSAILLRCGLASVYRVRMHVHHYPKSARTLEISESSYMTRHLYFLKIFKTFVTSAYRK